MFQGSEGEPCLGKGTAQQQRRPRTTNRSAIQKWVYSHRFTMRISLYHVHWLYGSLICSPAHCSDLIESEGRLMNLISVDANQRLVLLTVRFHFVFLQSSSIVLLCFPTGQLRVLVCWMLPVYWPFTTSTDFQSWILSTEVRYSFSLTKGSSSSSTAL